MLFGRWFLQNWKVQPLTFCRNNEKRVRESFSLEKVYPKPYTKKQVQSKQINQYTNNRDLIRNRKNKQVNNFPKNIKQTLRNRTLQTKHTQITNTLPHKSNRKTNFHQISSIKPPKSTKFHLTEHRNTQTHQNPQFQQTEHIKTTQAPNSSIANIYTHIHTYTHTKQIEYL